MKKYFIICGAFIYLFNCRVVEKVDLEIPNAKELYIAFDKDSTQIELINNRSPGIFRVCNQKKKLTLKGKFIFKKQTRLHTPILIFYPSDTIIGQNEQYPTFAFKIMKFDSNSFHARLLNNIFYSYLGLFDQTFKFRKIEK